MFTMKLGTKTAFKLRKQYEKKDKARTKDRHDDEKTACRFAYKEDISMNSQAVKMTWPRPLILVAFAIAFLLLQTGPLPAQADACALLKAADVAPLLGGAPTHTGSPQGQTCTWVGAMAKRKLLVLTYKNSKAPGEFAFMGARQGAQAQADDGVKVNDESGIGDKAFSAQESFGAVFMVLKQGRLLQLQYWTGGMGTTQDVAALRAVVKKAVAGF
jgi:hypothetical protein